MSASEIAAILTAAAALITSLALAHRARTEAAGLRREMRGQSAAVRTAATAATGALAELSPNHGSSVKDQLALVVDLVRSHGHQLGELRDDTRAIHEDHAARLRAIEKRL